MLIYYAVADSGGSLSEFVRAFSVSTAFSSIEWHRRTPRRGDSTRKGGARNLHSNPFCATTRLCTFGCGAARTGQRMNSST